MGGSGNFPKGVGPYLITASFYDFPDESPDPIQIIIASSL